MDIKVGMPCSTTADMRITVGVPHSTTAELTCSATADTHITELIHSNDFKALRIEKNAADVRRAYGEAVAGGEWKARPTQKTLNARFELLHGAVHRAVAGLPASSTGGPGSRYGEGGVYLSDR